MTFNHAASLRTFLADRREEIALAHRNGASGFATCVALSSLMDTILRGAYDALPASLAKPDIAILALGGYGRVELCPHSDIDLMVLCNGGVSKTDAEEVAKTFLHMLWDTGIDVGHSVRTVDEALAVHANAMDAWASMIESRFLCGNEKLAERLFGEMRGLQGGRKDSWFIDALFEELERRHHRYGNSVKLLEPNIKKSAGGLRDFQSVYWLFRGTGAAYFTRPVNDAPASKSFLQTLRHNGVISDDENVSITAALEFLFRARHEMHFRRRSAQDALEYTLQRDVAEGLGYGRTVQLRPVEVFMRDYYLHARSLYRFSQRLTHHFAETLDEDAQARSPIQKINDTFAHTESTLALGEGISRLDDMRLVFEAFVYAGDLGLNLDYRLQAAIEKSVAGMTDDDRRSPALAGLFRRILRSRRVADTLREMNDLGVLGAYIPEFAGLVAFFQHNVYHYFTADEHTLIAVANAEQLREQPGVLHEVFRALRRKEVLYLALLLHDIGKPRGVADHEVTGVQIAGEFLPRIGMQDALNDVSFLVRNHLIMEQIAFRRNIHDPATIREFAARFERPELLDYLYVHTYADLSAVNTNVWTEWKSSLLQELYQRTSEVLRRNLHGDQIDAYTQARHQATVESLVERLSDVMAGDAVRRHLRSIQSDSYVSLFTDEEIIAHIEKSERKGTVSTLFRSREGYTEVTVIAPDAPFALSRFCAVLSANDANIFDANIFTRDDGIIIDRFRVTDAATRKHLTKQVCEKVGQDMGQVGGGALDVEHLFEAHRRKWKRRPKPPANPNIRIDIEFEDNVRYTIVDVYAPDSLGFLYRITEVLSRLGLDIYFAKIATRVDGIVDAFYVLDRNGRPVLDPGERSAIRTELLNTIRMMSEQELA